MNLPTKGLLWAAAVCLALLGLADPAAGRSLYWRELSVEARLEADGALRVAETQTMVFTGDWNGGERVFRLGRGQAIELYAIARIDPETGERHELEKWDLSQVDHYDWADDRTLRWRSRLPSDPEFDETAITYELDYRLTGVLRPVGEGLYLLDHDFAFPQRSGPIEHFHLELAVDPAFAPEDELPASLDRQDLAPGESVVVTARLRYQGAGAPAAALPAPVSPVAFPIRVAGVAALLVALVWLFVGFARRESALGRRWGRVPQPPGIDRAWIEGHLLGLRPEEVGAYWDRAIGPPEVAAVLARMVSKGKLASDVEPGHGRQRDLRLRLLVDRHSLSGYERDLVFALFFGGRSEVTTAELRAHYKSSGFDPAEVIRSGLEERLKFDVHEGRGRPAPSRRPTAILALSTVGLLGLQAAWRWPAGLTTLLSLAFLVPPFYGLALGIAYAARDVPDKLRNRVIAFGVPMALMVAGTVFVVFQPELSSWFTIEVPPGILGLAALLLGPLAAWSSVLNAATSRERAETIAARQELLQARRHLKAELRRPEPDLDDAWFPYLLAFGLSAAMDRWAKAFGGVSASGLAAGAAAAGAFSGGGSSGGGWSGGGGSFGGAGASASWAAAATGMASGVSAPSSSSGGGGGGGGSSGGGGGGGW